MGIKLFWRAAFLSLVCVFGSPTWAGDTRAYALEGIRLGQHEGRTRVVFDISGAASHSVARLSNPSRIVLTIFDTENAADIALVPLENTPIRSIAVNSGDGTEMGLVLQLSSEVEYKAFALSSSGDRGDRIVLDLYPLASGGNDMIASAAASSLAEKSYTFDGIWEQEWAVETDGVNSQKFEALIEPRVDVNITEKAKLTAIARIRIDTVGDLGPDDDRSHNYSSVNGPFYNNAHAEISLRELYLDTQWSGTYWRIGKQQVVWGQADGIKVLDVVNPQSFREFILDDFDGSRIPLTMVNLQTPLGAGATLQLLWIPDTTYHELAERGTPYYLTSPLLVPVLPEGMAMEMESADVPDNPIKDGDFGGRLSGFIGGWDVTLNYLYHYQDYPVLYQNLKFTAGGPVGVVSPEYERSHLLGGTLSNVFGDFTFRAEAAYSTDTFHVANDISRRGIEGSADFSSVLGLDWHLADYDTLLSLQWFQSHLFDYEDSIYRGRNEQNLSFYYQRDFLKETWQFNTLALYSIDHQDSLVQLKLKYYWLHNLELWLGVDIFSGDRDGIYGQFSAVDRMLVGLKLGF